MNTAHFNRYDYYIILLIVSLAFGQVGGPLAVVRLTTIFLLPSVLRSYSYVQSYLKPFVFAYFFFCAYCLFSLIWTPDKVEGIKEICYYVIHFLLFIEIVIFGRFARSPLCAISLGWFAAVAIILPVSLWEFATDHHLSTSRYGYDGARYGNIDGIIVQKHFAAATFTNMNTFVVFLCFSLPFLFYGWLENSRCRVNSNIFLSVLMLSIICILFNASRGGIITIALMVTLYITISGNKKHSVWLVTFAVIAAFLVISYADTMLAFMKFRSRSDILLQGDSRFIIWQHAWEAFIESYGLGVGVGGMNAAMKSVTRGITITHNMFLEILLQYGVVFFLLFVFYLIRLFRKCLTVETKTVRMVLLMAIVPMPVYLIINSGYLLNPAVYVFFACITVFADYEHTQFLHKIIRSLVQ